MPAVQAITIESVTAGISVCDVPIPVGGSTPGNVNIIADLGEETIALSPGIVDITAPAVTITTTTFSVVTPEGIFTVG